MKFNEAITKYSTTIADILTFSSFWPSKFKMKDLDLKSYNCYVTKIKYLELYISLLYTNFL